MESDYRPHGLFRPHTMRQSNQVKRIQRRARALKASMTSRTRDDMGSYVSTLESGPNLTSDSRFPNSTLLLSSLDGFSMCVDSAPNKMRCDATRPKLRVLHIGRCKLAHGLVVLPSTKMYIARARATQCVIRAVECSTSLNEAMDESFPR